MKPKGTLDFEGLVKEFVTNHLTAAGISYLATSRSYVRRFIWLLCIGVCCSFMGYMTVKVITEYLRYPKMIIQEDVIFPSLPFPAVTICSLKPIANRFMNKTSLLNFSRLRILLKEAKDRPHRFAEMEKCESKPLCHWSWFRETCSCAQDPCLTEYCLLESQTHCRCSATFCRYFNISGCHLQTFMNNGRNYRKCLCKGQSFTPKAVEKDEEEEIQEELQKIFDKVEDKKVRNIIRLMKQAKTFDLVDVEDALKPHTYELYRYGPSLDHLIISCSYEKEPCGRENFTILYDPNYGKCFMFNYVGREFSGSEEPAHTLSYGSNSGLKLLLRVAGNNAENVARRQIGARIVIHDPRSLPFVSEYGVYIRPRDMASIELSLSTIQRLDKPWGDCVKNTIPEEETDEPYSIMNCEKECGFQYVTSRCNCTLRHLIRGSALSTQPEHFAMCDFGNKSQRNCAMKSSMEMENEDLCNCRPPCDEKLYKYSVTASELNEDYFKTVKAVNTLILDKDGKLNHIQYSDENSMIGIKIYFNSFMVSNQSEIASYSWETLVANIGGNLGFFMGLTLITFFEVIEFFWDTVNFFCKRTSTSKSEKHNRILDKKVQQKIFFYPQLSKQGIYRRSKYLKKSLKF